MADVEPDNVPETPFLVSLVSFLAAFCLVAAALHLALRPDKLYASWRSEKLLLIDQWQGRMATALFGASHGHNGFDPRTFDQTLADTPLRTTTLNLALEAGSQTEQRVMALHYLARLRPHPGQACFVILELNAGANFTNQDLPSTRAINIYDRGTYRFVTELAPRSLGTVRAGYRRAYALVAEALHYSNVGMLSDVIFTPPFDQDLMADQTNNDRRGYLTPPPYANSQASMVRLIGNMPRTMRPVQEPLLPGNYALVSELQKASPVHDVRFVYYVSPLMRDLTSYAVHPDSMEVNGVTVPILSIAQPNMYPDLYQAQYWHDDAHLSEKGAGLLGTYLAREMLAWYKDHPQPMSCEN